MNNKFGAVALKSYETVPGEVDTDLKIIEGECPEELRGTFYHNGIGRMKRNGVLYGHFFDGDGMV